MKNEYELSIIIPAYNEETLLPDCLAAVDRARIVSGRPHDVEVIVADNISTDRTAKIALEAGARVVFESEHLISKVKNAGARTAKGRWLLFVDADTVIDESAITYVLDSMANPGIIGGGAYVKYDVGGLVAVVSWALNRLFVSRGNAWGAFLFCDRAAFEKIGGFDETLYGTEEITLLKAIRVEAKKQGRCLRSARRYLAVTSGRRVNRQLREVSRRSLMLFNLKKNMQDPDVCRSVWYEETR